MRDFNKTSWGSSCQGQAELELTAPNGPIRGQYAGHVTLWTNQRLELTAPNGKTSSLVLTYFLLLLSTSRQDTQFSYSLKQSLVAATSLVIQNKRKSSGQYLNRSYRQNMKRWINIIETSTQNSEILGSGLFWSDYFLWAGRNDDLIFNLYWWCIILEGLVCSFAYTFKNNCYSIGDKSFGQFPFPMMPTLNCLHIMRSISFFKVFANAIYERHLLSEVRLSKHVVLHASIILRSLGTLRISTKSGCG